ncbi:MULTISPECIES: BrnT family toxin [Burkholderia]|uniref:Toxin n=1 Tax=Burkholderia mayonis TaxID=1385591 RepID=A0A1B4FIG8_9BURK|nr:MULTISPECIES: BrnT family toxin [Burkholderia]AOJ03463.1 toxin [Burkholderia mayonis]KVE44867.1 toxin [Burkholderia sp. BDU5]KVE46868.1 toxin [Burkholderia mayonis]
MDITYDPNKSERNIVERGLSFELAREFEMAGALIVEDVRMMYPERRFQALVHIGDRLRMLVFTPRDGMVHVISLRKANSREVKGYEQAKST